MSVRLEGLGNEFERPSTKPTLGICGGICCSFTLLLFAITFGLIFFFTFELIPVVLMAVFLISGLWVMRWYFRKSL